MKLDLFTGMVGASRLVSEKRMELLSANATPLDSYALALGTGDGYTAQLAAALNGKPEVSDGGPGSELVVEEPDF